MDTNSEQFIESMSRAMFAPGFPGNPLPFLNVLSEGVKRHGTYWIHTDTAKKILFVLIAQAYGQSFKLDAYTEYERLLKTKEK